MFISILPIKLLITISLHIYHHFNKTIFPFREVNHLISILYMHYFRKIIFYHLIINFILINLFTLIIF